MDLHLQVRSDVFDQMASGGHQGYAALGGLYTQSRPLEPHLYGSVDEQWRERPVSNNHMGVGGRGLRKENV